MSAKAAARTIAGAQRAVARRVVSDEAGILKAGLGAMGGGGVLAGYLPMRSEADPRPAMRAWHDAGHPVCVPVVEGPGRPLRFRDWTPAAALRPGGFGTLVPAAGIWRVPDIVIVPLLSFDRRGRRLGYGGGFYDRTLALLRGAGSVTAVGLAFAAQEVDAVPVDAWDAPLDAVATEAAWIEMPQG